VSATSAASAAGSDGRQMHVEADDARAAREEELAERGQLLPRQRLALAELLERVVVDQHEHDLGRRHPVAEEEEEVDRARLPP